MLKELLRGFGRAFRPQSSENYVFDTNFSTEEEKTKEEVQRENIMIIVGALMFISLIASFFLLIKRAE